MQTFSWPAPEPGRGERAKLRLLDAAAHVFGEKGPAGATVREIASAAGQNVAAIAYHFGGKENLYRAVLEGVVQIIRNRMADVLQEIASARRNGGPAPREALRLLKRFITEFYLRILSRTEAIRIGRLIVREQTEPSSAFEILYEKAFRDLHETLCFLVGRVLGWKASDRETILRTHSLMGQVWFFAVSRETILRRLGWRSLGGRNAETVATMLGENVEALLSGLAAMRQTKTGSPV